MAKKKAKKNARRKGRTAAQKRATAKLVARNKAHKSNPKKRKGAARRRSTKSNPKRSAARRSNGSSMKRKRAKNPKRRAKRNPVARSNPRRRRHARRNPKLDYMEIAKPVMYGAAAAAAGIGAAFLLSKAPLTSTNKMIAGNAAAGLVAGALVGLLSPTAGMIVAAAFFQQAGTLGVQEVVGLRQVAQQAAGQQVGDIVEQRYLESIVDNPALQGFDDDVYAQQAAQAGY